MAPVQYAVAAVARARMEAGYAMAALRPYIHDPEIQGMIQALQLVIDDAALFLAKHQHGENSNERKRIRPAAGSPPPSK